MLQLAFVALLMAQDTEQARAESKLRNMKISLEYKQTDLESVLGYIRDFTDLNFFLSKKAREKGEVLVSITVKDISVRSALMLILKPHGLTVLWQEGVFMITTPDEEPVVMEIYDVRDLLHQLKDMPGVEIDLNPNALGATISGADDGAEQPVLPLEEILKAHTGGKSWDENPKCTLSLNNGLLVVRQTREVHKQIKKIIGQLRQYK